MMIFVRDKGRMCNNILQYGHVYAWGREHGRKTMSMRFAYKYQYFRICSTRYHNFFVYLFAKYAAKFKLIPIVGFHQVDNSDTTSLEAIMQENHLVLVEGWWVPWHNLFLKYKREIIELFAFKEAIMSPVDELLKQLHGSDIHLGVHIRRGDYRTWHNGKYYYTDEQYLSYISQFLALHPQQTVTVFICGNDQKLDREYFRQSLKDCTVVFPEGNPGEDLYLLSCCDYLIGAPSTFTLVASMYHDTPLCWIMDANQPMTEKSFGYFDELLQHIV